MFLRRFHPERDDCFREAKAVTESKNLPRAKPRGSLFAGTSVDVKRRSLFRSEY
jgi:hypothetical protein